jgi:hypothetical protein
MLQRHVVPWLIALRGLSFAKTVKIDLIKQMVIAVLDADNLLQGNMTAEEAAAAYPVAFTDVAKKVKHAAGM